MWWMAIGWAMTVPQCTAADAALPPPLAGWARQGEGLDTRHAFTLPTRNGAAETRVTIRKAGIFGIATDQPGWVDVTRSTGRRLRMVSRDPARPCAKIEKIVYYRLAPGIYRVSIGRLQAARVKLMLVRGERMRGFARSGRVG
ncbi:hypothetical protein ACNFJ7_12105 [Sphingomonas sp. HT-1]|jgi:hypothetical protein|uniref:hypothetical protein n=1 Tax=unclassified Sphingomonas TaxID=196159 RepID=UPI0002F04BEE|nr:MULTISPECIES: hypothetical protein [unclassified Sphingomonas]